MAKHQHENHLMIQDGVSIYNHPSGLKLLKKSAPVHINARWPSINLKTISWSKMKSAYNHPSGLKLVKKSASVHIYSRWPSLNMKTISWSKRKSADNHPRVNQNWTGNKQIETSKFINSGATWLVDTMTTQGWNLALKLTLDYPAPTTLFVWILCAKL